MKVCFVRTTTNAVGIYRAEHPARALRDQGHEVKLLTLGEEAQQVSLADLHSDVLVLCRTTSPSVFELIDKFRAEDRPKVVYEVDDNPWEWHPTDPIHRKLGSAYARLVSQSMARCDAVTTTTPTLAARIWREFPTMPVWVVPNAIDYQYRHWDSHVKREDVGLEDRHVVLGWTGSAHHGKDGQQVIAALPKVFSWHPDAVFLMQCDRPVFEEWTAGVGKEWRDRLRHVPPVGFSEHPAVYSLFDVNLAPLEDTKFNRCKSDLRLIEGGAQGVPYVASNIAPYRDFHFASGGIGGHLAQTASEWATAIDDVLSSEEAARGSSLSEYVRNTRSLEVVVGQWVAALTAIKDGSRPVEVAAEKIDRNQPCRCGSGRKAKRCCYREQ